MNAFPGLARGVAALMRYAADHSKGLTASIPCLTAVKPCWKPSGLVETAAQLKSVVEKRRRKASTGADVLRPDMAQRTPTIPKRLGRSGPCNFCCTVTSRNDRYGPRWYAVPSPPPLGGLTAGETLCAKCYDWLIANKRRRIANGGSVPALRTSTAIIQGLVRCAHLNGEEVTVE